MSRGRLLVTIFFIALLLTPVLYKQALKHKQAPSARSKQDMAALASYGFRLRESAKASGINFRHKSPKLDSKLDHIMEQIASMGAAVSVVDFDRDGWDDIY